MRCPVVKVGVRISCFMVNGCHVFSLFQGDVHVLKSDRLLRHLEGEFDNGLEVLHKVDEIQELVLAH